MKSNKHLFIVMMLCLSSFGIAAQDTTDLSAFDGTWICHAPPKDYIDGEPMIPERDIYMKIQYSDSVISIRRKVKSAETGNTTYHRVSNITSYNGVIYFDILSDTSYDWNGETIHKGQKVASARYAYHYRVLLASDGGLLCQKIGNTSYYYGGSGSLIDTHTVEYVEDNIMIDHTDHFYNEKDNW